MPRHRVAGNDEGFSLVETIVALALIIVTMGTMGPYLIGSFRYVAHQRGEQAAAILANSALEQVRALKGSSLASGRGKLSAYNQFGLDVAGTVSSALVQPDAAVADFLADMTPAYDKNATGTDGANAPIATRTVPVTVDKISYDRTIYLGLCEVDLRTEEGQNGGCVRPTVHPANADPTDFLQFFRAVVLVAWKDKLCAVNACSYVSSTLVSMAADPTFPTNRPLPQINRKNVNPIYFYYGIVTSYTIPVYGGTLPNKWTTKPTVPDGLTLNATNGMVTGTPTKIGKVKSSGTVTDSATPAHLNTAELNFEVVAPPSVSVPAEIRTHPGDTLNVPVTVTGGSPYINGCTLTKQPAGLTLEPGADARIYFLKGSYSGATPGLQLPAMKIACLDQPRSVLDRYARATPKLTFWPAAQVTPPADLKVTLPAAVNTTATASGGDGVFTYSATGLPSGVSIAAATGVISGTATVTGRYLPAVQVVDGIGGTSGTASKTFVLAVDSTSSVVFNKPALTTPDPTGKVGTPTTFGPFDTNALLMGLTTTISSPTGLPPGLTWNAVTKTISGTPTTAGTYPVNVAAKNLLGTIVSNYNFVWTIAQ
jgi:type II secretory pathway pseudopilin PulG